MLLEAAIGHAIDGDAEQAAHALQTIGEASNTHEMYGVCCGIATVGHHVLKLLYGPAADGASWGMTELEPGALGKDPARQFAMRFLVAYSNGDTEMCLALYDATVRATDDEYVDSICALLATVAELARLALDEKRKGTLPG